MNDQQASGQHVNQGQAKKPKLKQKTTWLGGAVLLGTAAATWLGKPQLADPQFWQAILTVASAVGLIATDEARG